MIALIPDPDDRARDITSSTFIQRTTLANALQIQLQEASLVEQAYIYAEAGMWYDALASLDSALQANPDDEALKFDRIHLFEQVGLKKAAVSEKQRMSIEN